jgi:hypothetical protein
MIVQISETEINNQLATAFLAGMIIPSSMEVPVNTAGLTGTASLNFQTPIADLDRPRPRMGITIPFVNSQLQVVTPVAFTIAPLGGTITIVDSIEVITEGTNEIVTMDFNAGAPVVTVSFDTASQAVLAPVLAATGMTLAQAENTMAGIVLQELQTNIGRIDLTPPIAVVDDMDPLTVFNIDVTTINDTTAADRDCIAFGVKMASDSGGNINSVTTNFIPAGSESLVMMSNFWLLARVMRPIVASSLGLVVTDFDTPMRLNHNVPAPGGQGTLTRLEARVEGNRIRVDGRATDSGTGWSAVSNFNFFIDLSLSGGSITVTATTPSVDTDVDLEWWVWLASLGLGGLFGGIAGVIVAAIVLAIIEAVAEGIVNGLVSGGISGSLGAIPPIPLGPIGGGLSLASLLLDDLELRCSILKSVTVPIKSQGSHTSFAGFTLDLDRGIIGTSTLPSTDLVWNPSTGITTNIPAGLTITGTRFGALTPVQVSRFPLASMSVALHQVPVTFPESFPFLPHDEVVFGVRTTDGRYAKVRAWRSIVEGGALKLDWVTFDTPVPQLDIAGRWSVIERGEVTEYITPDCEYCRSSPVAWMGVFEAWPRLMAFPVDYQWCLCGTVLKPGEGEVTTKNGTITYKLNGKRLEIKTELGDNLDCELCVSAIDFRGRELFTCIKLLKPGIDRQCRKCTPSKLRNYDTHYLPIAKEVINWRPLLTHVKVD